MRTLTPGTTVMVPRYLDGEVVGYVSGKVRGTYRPRANGYMFHVVETADGNRGYYPREVFLPGEPRHRSDGPVDSGASSDPRHHQFKPRAKVFTDAWAGNPDTDKYWSK